MNNEQLLTGETKYGKMSYYNKDIFFCMSLMTGKIYEQDIVENDLAEIIKKSKRILDIGAHCGSHSIMYSKINPNAEIHSFEPQKRLYTILNKNITDNSITNIKTYNYALGNKNCDAEMANHCTDGPNAYNKLDETNQFNYGGLQIGIGGEPIKIQILDQINFDKIDYIKIDVEGFENLVVDGGYETIKKYNPIIFFEHNSMVITKDMVNYYNTPRYKNIIETLQSLDYVIIERERKNFLGIPKNKLHVQYTIKFDE
jgi:FkbM family methyltransferase